MMLEYLIFSCGGFLSHHEKLLIQNCGGRIEIFYILSHRPHGVLTFLRSHDIWTKARSKRWSDKIESVQLDKWEDEYFDLSILDGTQWSVRYKLKGNEERTVSGSNAFPDDWGLFYELMRSIIRKLPNAEKTDIEGVYLTMLKAESGIVGSSENERRTR